MVKKHYLGIIFFQENLINWPIFHSVHSESKSNVCNLKSHLQPLKALLSYTFCFKCKPKHAAVADKPERFWSERRSRGMVRSQVKWSEADNKGQKKKQQQQQEHFLKCQHLQIIAPDCWLLIATVSDSSWWSGTAAISAAALETLVCFNSRWKYMQSQWDS